MAGAEFLAGDLYMSHAYTFRLQEQFLRSPSPGMWRNGRGTRNCDCRRYILYWVRRALGILSPFCFHGVPTSVRAVSTIHRIGRRLLVPCCGCCRISKYKTINISANNFFIRFVSIVRWQNADFWLTICLHAIVFALHPYDQSVRKATEWIYWSQFQENESLCNSINTNHRMPLIFISTNNESEKNKIFRTRECFALNGMKILYRRSSSRESGDTWRRR